MSSLRGRNRKTLFALVGSLWVASVGGLICLFVFA